MEEARQALTQLRQDTPDRHQQVESNLAYITYTTELEKAETENATFADCFKGTNLRRTEINCVVWAAQILCGNAVLGFSVVFLEAAGFNEVQAFDLNISLSACYIVGGAICWLLMPRLGRATLYVSLTVHLLWIPVFHVLECSRMQHFRVRSRTNVPIRWGG